VKSFSRSGNAGGFVVRRLYLRRSSAEGALADDKEEFDDQQASPCGSSLHRRDHRDRRLRRCQQCVNRDGDGVERRLTLPTIPGLGGGSTGSAPAATTLLTAADVQTISGDSGVTALTGACFDDHLHLLGHDRQRRWVAA